MVLEKKRQKLQCHVICCTHWDREWLKPFQVYRMQLVEYIDRLLTILDKYPEFKHYHLDSQSILLEDYLEIRPENTERIKIHVKSGRLMVGPWYTLPDMNMVDGESIVRNLAQGHRLCRSLGRVMKVGYTPTSTGQISQLPQLYQGFDIDSAIFYRGINPETGPTEYIWQSPDGSEVLGIRPPARCSRANFWVNVFLPTIFGVRPDDVESWQYKLSDGGMPFKVAESNEQEYKMLAPVYGYNDQYIKHGVDAMLGDIIPDMTTHHVLCFNGHDQSPAYWQTPKIIDDINGLCEGIECFHSSLPKYISKIRESLKYIKTAKIIQGEMRHTNRSWPKGCGHLYAGALTTRIYLKQENWKTENQLIRLAEPAATIASLISSKFEYPHAFFDMAWRMLLTNQTHDCMMGCSVDKVHEDMMYRFSEIQLITDGVEKRNFASLVKDIDTKTYAADSVLLGCFNLLPNARNEIVRVAIDLPGDSKCASIILKNSQKEPISLQIIKSYKTNRSVESEGFKKAFNVHCFEVYLELNNLPACGYDTFLVEPDNSKVSQISSSLANGHDKMENEHLIVKINTNGTLDLTCKETDRTYKGLHYFDDIGEAGNAWTLQTIQSDRAYTSEKGKAVIKIVENGPLKATFEIKIKMHVPVSATEDYKERSKHRQALQIVSLVSLTKTGRTVDIQTMIENSCKDHRLRVLFPSRINSQYSFAAMPFDVVKRKIKLPDCKNWTEPASPMYPQRGFVDISDGKNGLAIISQGLPEYEVIDDRTRTIAITLLKAIYQKGNWSTQRWPDKGFQCLGAYKANYSIYPHKGDWQQANIYTQLNRQSVPVKIVQFGQNNKGRLPKKLSFLTMKPTLLQLSALKRADEGEGLIVRLLNPTGRNQNGKLVFCQQVVGATVCKLDEKPHKENIKLKIAGNAITFKVSPHRIITLRISLALKQANLFLSKI